MSSGPGTLEWKAAPASDRERDPHAWADYLDYMEGVDPSAFEAPASAPPAASRPLAGLLATGALTVAALGMSELPFPPFRDFHGRPLLDPIVIAILLGIAVCQAAPRWTSRLKPGLHVAVKTVLPIGIALIGARLHFADLLKVGFLGLLVSVVLVFLCLLLFVGPVRKLFGLNLREAFLWGVGTSICGGTAIVAVSPVLRAKDGEVVTGVAAVTVAGLLGMVLLPLLGHALSLGQAAFGFWTGLSLHQLPQVVAAGFAYGNDAGTAATLVKMARICLLAPMAVLAAWCVTRWPKAFGVADEEAAQGRVRWVPPFMIAFVALAAAHSLGLLPEMRMDWHLPWADAPSQIHFSIDGLLTKASVVLIAIGMAAVGLETRVHDLLRAGRVGLMAVLTASVLLAAAALGLALVLY